MNHSGSSNCQKTSGGPSRVVGLCALVCAASVFLVIGAWYFAGRRSPTKPDDKPKKVYASVIVSSGSMADILLGPHVEVSCSECGYRFVFDAQQEHLPSASRVPCPNCGEMNSWEDSGKVIAGDHVFVDKQAFETRRPRRWELVTFYSPPQPDTLAVKRVVGLPGESIQICHGDIYIDGKIVRKTLAEQRAVATTVHDSNFFPKRWGHSSQWKGCSAESRWQLKPGHFVHPGSNEPNSEPNTSKQSQIDWLSYRHFRGRQESAVMDDYGYNQGLSRKLNDVADLMITCRVQTSGKGRLLLLVVDSRNKFVIRLDPTSQQLTLHRGDHRRDHRGEKLLAKRSVEMSLESGEVQLVFSMFDQQILLALDEKIVLDFPLEGRGCGEGPHTKTPQGKSDLPRQPTTRPLAIGSEGLRIEISDLKVFRDVYYTHPLPDRSRPRWALASPYCLGPDEYFVLGDNSPLSDDSRTWPEGPGLAAKLLVGKPLLVRTPR